MRKSGGEFRLWFLCLSPECRERLDRLADENIVAVSLGELEAFDSALLTVKPERSPSEYIFTLTAAWMTFLFGRHSEIDILTYLDADLYFFSNYEAVFRELGDASIGIIEHRHARAYSDRLQYGRFNVGWVSIRRDEEGLRCVRRWREQCIEWCYDRPEDGKFGDQKYLDEWPTLYRKVKIIDHPGANLAPWNLGRHKVSGVWAHPAADGRPVLFYHFTNMWQSRPSYVWTGLGDYEISTARKWIAAKLLYKPYLEAVMHASARLEAVGYRDIAFNYSRHSVAGDPSRKPKSLVRRWEKWSKFMAERIRAEVLRFAE
ncbi:hypothetical protein TSACC_2397 [Terrimicrobium sacchariphilum]|uniref:Glycosyl transferase family 8 n=1 Tax=Terrimicrobium sacchariphilum TaxID=690879 RepID=A0A146G2X3_TERSA|nr:hypothetical protein TSACC_2397 [Terrimicrobium sacchariphilum]